MVRNEKWKTGELNCNARVLRHKCLIELYVIQDNRVYVLCKVAQVFSARGSRPIHSFVCITLLWEGKYVHTLYFIDLCYY